MHPLDNVIWNSLTTAHSSLATRRGAAGRFFPDICILGGFAEPSAENYLSLLELVEQGSRVGLFLESYPNPPAGWETASSVSLLQMSLESDRQFKSTASDLKTEFISLTEKDAPEMLALAELTMPGPFALRTREMGDYFGIREGDKLIAMAGERLRLPGFTEISGVCTHPDYAGRGLASALIRLLLERIRTRKEEPFLHVRESNTAALRLYERLGFRKRARFHYTILRNASGQALVQVE